MATYPILTSSLPSYASAEKTLDDLQVDRASNGAPRVRALFATAKKTFTVVHEFCNDPDKLTLAAFYAANRLLAITFVWPADSASYSCYFGAAPQYEVLIDTHWKITVELVEA